MRGLERQFTSTWYHVDLRRAALLGKVAQLTLLVACACGGTSHRQQLAGVSDVAISPTPRHEPEPSRAAIWPEFAQLRTWSRANAEPFRSQGHPELRGNVDVYVSSASLEVYVALVADSSFPEGTIISEVPHNPTRGQNTYVLQRRNSTWEFLILDARGIVLEQGAPSTCIRCHAEAAAAPIFGLPRSAARPTATP